MCTHDAMRSEPIRQGGLTLIELIMFIVIVGVGVTGVLSVMNVSARHGGDPMVRKQALAVAESLLEEILAHDFADPDGVEPEESRALYDDVSDYDGLTSAGIRDLTGAVIPALASYSASVSVDAGTAWAGIPAGQVKRVTVTVTSSAGEVIALSGYRTNH